MKQKESKNAKNAIIIRRNDYHLRRLQADNEQIKHDTVPGKEEIKKRKRRRKYRETRKKEKDRESEIEIYSIEIDI